MQETKKSISPAAGKSRIISTIVSPAIRLWLQTQVEQGEDLQVKIEGGDRQILSGYVPCVVISAQNVIYQGLHLSQLHLIGKGIRINLGQILRGKPLQLLEPVPIEVDLVLREVDLNASLQAPLLATALAEILVSLLQAVGPTDLAAGLEKSINLHNPQIFIGPDQLTLDTTLVPVSGNPIPTMIRTGLQLENDHILRLDHPQWLLDGGTRGESLELTDFKMDLGPEVALQELTLSLGLIVCRGRITVVPA